MAGVYIMNVLIVDDQKDVANSIKKSVHWEKSSIKNVYMAYSANDARNVIENHSIHILLCDIEMPQESGLEFFRWIRVERPEIECIFLTSHAEFEYAKEALHLGGFDYILQPAMPEEIEDAINKVCVKITRSHQYQKLKDSEGLIKEQKELLLDAIILELIQDKMQNDLPTMNISMFLEKTYNSLYIYPVCIHITKWKTNFGEWESNLIRQTLSNILVEIFQSANGETLLSKIDKNHYIFLLCHEEHVLEQNEIICALNQFYEFVMQYMEFEIALYCGNDTSAISFYPMIQRCFEQEKDNVMLLSQIFYDYTNTVNQDLKGALLLLHMEQWEEWLENGHGKKVRDEIERYMMDIQKKGNMRAQQLKYMHTNFTKSFYCVLGKQHINIGAVFSDTYTYEQYMEAGNHYHTFMEAVDYVLKYLEHTYEMQEDPDANQIEKAIVYIRNNIDKNINRGDVAAHVFLNKEYFSRYFKKHTGYMLKDFILNEKMQFAKNLLESTKLSVSIVASKVGYSNFSHFSRVFRKTEGMTPQEYRQKFR